MNNVDSKILLIDLRINFTFYVFPGYRFSKLILEIQGFSPITIKDGRSETIILIGLFDKFTSLERNKE